MTPPALGGLHHLTAVTAKAPANLTMATRVLGLRLVKRTVNQDDVSAYHLFYGDPIGRPGTELTFFEWAHVPPRQPGHGEVGETGLRVPGHDALDWWEERLRESGTMIVRGRTERAGRAVLRFSDAEGQPFALTSDPDAHARAHLPPTRRWPPPNPPGGNRRRCPASARSSGWGRCSCTCVRSNPRRASSRR